MSLRDSWISAKDKWHSLQDRWDKFKASPFQTHLAAAFCGAVVALYLRTLL